MKAYTACLWIVVFNLALSVINLAQPFSAMSGAPEYIFPVDSSLFLGADGYLDLSIDGLDDINFLSWMAIFFSAICNATIALPFMLANLGVPNILIPLLVVPAYYTYLAAGFQLVTGRTLPFFT